MGCMSLPLELNAAEGIIAPAGIFALTIFLVNRKKHEENFVGLKTLPIFAKNIRIIMAKSNRI